MKVFLVNLSTGSYSDHRVQNLAVFSDYSLAKEFCSKIDRTFEALKDYNKTEYHNSEGVYGYEYCYKKHPDFDTSKYDLFEDVFNDYVGGYEVEDYSVYITGFIVDEPDPYNKKLEALE